MKFDKKCANSTRRGYLSPLNSIVLEIAATYYSSASHFFADFGAHFVETQARVQQTCLFSWTYARAAYSAAPQKLSGITFQPTYANLLSSKITYGIKIHKGWKSHKNLFQRKIYFNE